MFVRIAFELKQAVAWQGIGPLRNATLNWNQLALYHSLETSNHGVALQGSLANRRTVLQRERKYRRSSGNFTWESCRENVAAEKLR